MSADALADLLREFLAMQNRLLDRQVEILERLDALEMAHRFVLDQASIRLCEQDVRSMLEDFERRGNRPSPGGIPEEVLKS